MARRLEEAYKESKHEILPDLRRKFALDLDLTDKELFEGYPLKDLFMDGKLHECFFYMYQHSSLQIPDSWVDTMANFNRDLQLAVTQRTSVFLINCVVLLYTVNLLWWLQGK